MVSGLYFASFCEHDPESTLERPDEEAFYATSTIVLGTHNPGTGSEGSDRIAVIATHENDDMRFLALSNQFFTRSVIRENACLQCCLKICRREGLSYVLC